LGGGDGGGAGEAGGGATKPALTTWMSSQVYLAYISPISRPYLP